MEITHMLCFPHFLTEECTKVLVNAVDCEMYHVPESWNRKQERGYDETMRFDFKVQVDGQNGVMDGDKFLPLKNGVVVIYPTKFAYVNDERVQVPTITEPLWDEFLSKVETVFAKHGALSYNMFMAVLDKVGIKHSTSNFVPGFDNGNGQFVYDRNGEKQYLTRYYFSYENPEITNNVFSHLKTDAS
jgi:hypothetical protein